LKALYRRALASNALKKFEDSARDLQELLKLEPANKDAKVLLNNVMEEIMN
jgi:hypothetical protein